MVEMQGNEENHRVILPPSHDWGAALVAACVALGVTLAWANYEVRQRLNQQSDFAQFRHHLDLLVSQQNDLGQLLADPRTRLIRLLPQAGDGNWNDASVAWNDSLQDGALFCRISDGSAGQRFQIWLVPATGEAAGADLGLAAAGRTVYPFSPVGKAIVPCEFLVTPWSDSLGAGASVLARGGSKQTAD